MVLAHIDKFILIWLKSKHLAKLSLGNIFIKWRKPEQPTMQLSSSQHIEAQFWYMVLLKQNPPSYSAGFAHRNHWSTLRWFGFWIGWRVHVIDQNLSGLEKARFCIHYLGILFEWMIPHFLEVIWIIPI